MKTRYLLPAVFLTAIAGTLVVQNLPQTPTMRHSSTIAAPHRVAEKPWYKVYTPPPPKPKQLGCCEYDRPPCWCAESNVGYAAGCQSAEEYIQDVNMYGPPRCGIVVDFQGW